VVGEEDRGSKLTLNGAEIAEDRGDLGSGVLVDPGEAYERVEDDESGLRAGDGRAQASYVLSAVEAERVHVEEEERGVLEAR
jgi:hypothetical protein